jgi:protoporphyrinogen oxidase
MKIGIFGAGFAGLSAAYFLREKFPDLHVIEAADEYGGLARSFEWNGFTCDLAPHRLYTQNADTLAAMESFAPLREMRRYSKIFIGGKWISDPVNAPEIMAKFFPHSLGIAASYLATKFKAPLPEDNFDALCLNQFGHGLNEFFFKPYSEKLFGIPAHEIAAAWGRRKLRVGGIKDMIRRNSKLYFRTFHYPEKGGYGAICEGLHRAVGEDRVRLGTKVVGVEKNDGSGYRCTLEGKDGGRQEESFDLLVSSLPVSGLASLLGCDLNLRFRPARLMYLLIDKPRVTPNHWFYFADREHIINRVAEFRNFGSCEDAPAGQTVVCCEVTRVEDFSEARVIKELGLLGTFQQEHVLDTKIIDLPLAYPVYDLSYETETAKAESFFQNHPGLVQIGRHAQFAHRDVDEIFEEAERQCAEFVSNLESGKIAAQ